VAIVDPTGLDQLLPLIREAYEFAARKYSNHQARQTS
jgi:hypothetical protein